ncbi:MAG: hypothetical protein ACLGGV_06975 [Bacteroidia bacterium]
MKAKLIHLFLLITIGAILLSASKQDNNLDKELFGTWFHLKNEKLQYLKFNENGTFELSFNGKEVNEVSYKEKGIDCSFTYSVDQTKTPKTILLNLEISLPDSIIYKKMNGVYQILSNNKLKIDLNDNSKGIKSNFTSKSEIFYKTKEFISLYEIDTSYVFTRLINGEIQRDTIYKSNKQFKAIDSIYIKSMK